MTQNNSFSPIAIVVWNQSIACYSYIRELVCPDDEVRIATEEERLRYFSINSSK